MDAVLQPLDPVVCRWGEECDGQVLGFPFSEGGHPSPGFPAGERNACLPTYSDDGGCRVVLENHRGHGVVAGGVVILQVAGLSDRPA